MYLSAPMSSRNQFGQYLNEQWLTGTAVEVGTHRGEFANILLSKWKGRMLHCVDPWNVPKGYENQVYTLPDKGPTREDDYRYCAQTLLKYHGRVLLHRALSKDACQEYGDNSMDFVYIDGDHNLQAVNADLRLWWHKVKKGGILAGHDWLCPGEKDGGWGRDIQAAVDMLMRRYDIDVYLIVEEKGLPWSYYMVKQ